GSKRRASAIRFSRLSGDSRLPPRPDLCEEEVLANPSAARRSLLEETTMIKGMHGLFYSPEAEAVRAFLKDKLELPSVDAGEGWLIFGVPKAEIGVHPGDGPRHELS